MVPVTVVARPPAVGSMRAPFSPRQVLHSLFRCYDVQYHQGDRAWQRSVLAAGVALQAALES